MRPNWPCRSQTLDAWLWVPLPLSATSCGFISSLPGLCPQKPAKCSTSVFHTHTPCPAGTSRAHPGCPWPPDPSTPPPAPSPTARASQVPTSSQPTFLEKSRIFLTGSPAGFGQTPLPGHRDLPSITDLRSASYKPQCLRRLLLLHPPELPG